jgi:hypothetical protein
LTVKEVHKTIFFSNSKVNIRIDLTSPHLT